MGLNEYTGWESTQTRNATQWYAWPHDSVIVQESLSLVLRTLYQACFRLSFDRRLIYVNTQSTYMNLKPNIHDAIWSHTIYKSQHVYYKIAQSYVACGVLYRNFLFHMTWLNCMWPSCNVYSGLQKPQGCNKHGVNHIPLFYAWRQLSWSMCRARSGSPQIIIKDGHQNKMTTTINIPAFAWYTKSNQSIHSPLRTHTTTLTV